MNQIVQRAWAGIDIGKRHHWVCLVDSEGETIYSSKVANDEREIRAVLAAAQAEAENVVWAVDIVGTMSALMLTVLFSDNQQVRYACGRLVSAMGPAFSGEGKTDAKDAYIIAQTARLRPDLPVIDTAMEQGRELELLTAHRNDLANN